MIVFLESIDVILVILMCLTIHRVDTTLRGLLLGVLSSAKKNFDMIKDINSWKRELDKEVRYINRRIEELEDERK